jgi:endonuclease-3
MSLQQIVDVLIERGNDIVNSPRKRFDFTRENTLGLSNRERQDRAEANDILNDIETYPHVFVLGCLMNRQYSVEKCWIIPYRFVKDNRIGSFSFTALRGTSRKLVADWMSNPPKHRFHRKVADVFYSGIQRIDKEYSGDASEIWQGNPRAATVIERFRAFKGAGSKIANMAAHILFHRFKVPMSDLSSIDIPADRHVCHVFQRLGLIRSDIPSAQVKKAVIAAARQFNPSYPAVFDCPAWLIGRKWCHEQSPDCTACPMKNLCPSSLAP